VRVLTYNIHHAEGYDGRVSPGRIARIIAESGADVVALNEVWRLGNLYDQTTRLAEQLAMEHAYQPAGRYLALRTGNAVLTRGRITGARPLALPRGVERRVALACDIEVAGEALAVAPDEPLTFPARRPRRALDHVAFSEHWRLVATGAVRSLASDHLALWADLEPA